MGENSPDHPSRADAVCPHAVVNTLPHNTNQQLWRKKESDACPLCGERQTLIHVLNCCRVAQDLRRYNQRHDLVLGVIADAVRQKLPSSSGFLADLSDNYSFPLHIASTDLRPDLSGGMMPQRIYEWSSLQCPLRRASRLLQRGRKL